MNHPFCKFHNNLKYYIILLYYYMYWSWLSQALFSRFLENILSIFNLKGKNDFFHKSPPLVLAFYWKYPSRNFDLLFMPPYP